MAEEDTTLPTPHEGATPVRGSDVTRLVRMSLLTGADFTVWLTKFEMYTQQSDIAEPQRVKELLSLLEDEPFRDVSQHGLLETGDYRAVTRCLRQHYARDGNELEWQYKLQTRTQRPGEQLADFTGALRVLADKAYPTWPVEQQQEILRGQFIQGIHSSSVQVWSNNAPNSALVVAGNSGDRCTRMHWLSCLLGS